MAKDNKRNSETKKKFKDISKRLLSQEDRVSIKTWGSTNKLERETEREIAKSMKAIEKVISSTNSITNGNSLVHLSLTDKKNRGGKSSEKNEESIKDILKDDDMIEKYSQYYFNSRSRQDLIYDYNIIKKYMLTVGYNLESMASDILSPDDYTKNALDINVKDSEKIDTDVVKSTRKDYEIDSFISKVVTDTLVQGKQYVYCAPYKEIFSDVLEKKTKNLNENAMIDNIRENTIFNESTLNVTEGVGDNFSILKENYGKAVVDDTLESLCESLEVEDKEVKNNIRDYLEYLEETIDVKSQYDLPLFAQREESVATSNDSMEFIQENSAMLDNVDKVFKNIDSRRNRKKKSKKVKREKLDISGCIMKQLDYDKLVPIMVNDTCLGYYYFEKGEVEDFKSEMKNPFSQIETMTNRKVDKNVIGEKIAEMIYNQLDKKMIESNEHIKKELYDIVKYQQLQEGKSKISYIPPEYVTEFKINNGESKLKKVVGVAKLYVVVFLSALFMKLTRSADKRVYYIKRGIDKSIVNNVKRAANEIKKNNFNIDHFNDMNSVLRRIGKFDDIFMPLSRNGEKAIDFDILSGQDLDVDTDLLEKLEQIVLNGIGMPYGLSDIMGEVDYSRRIVTLNARHLNNIIKAQNQLKYPIENLVNNGLCYETELESLDCDVVLPPPRRLLLESSIEQMDNVNEMVDNAIELMATRDDEDDEEFMSKFKQELFKDFMPSGLMDIDRLA